MSVCPCAKVDANRTNCVVAQGYEETLLYSKAPQKQEPLRVFPLNQRHQACVCSDSFVRYDDVQSRLPISEVDPFSRLTTKKVQRSVRGVVAQRWRSRSPDRAVRRNRTKYPSDLIDHTDNILLFSSTPTGKGFGFSGRTRLTETTALSRLWRTLPVLTSDHTEQQSGLLRDSLQHQIPTTRGDDQARRNKIGQNQVEESEIQRELNTNTTAPSTSVATKTVQWQRVCRPSIRKPFSLRNRAIWTKSASRCNCIERFYCASSKVFGRHTTTGGRFRCCLTDIAISRCHCTRRFLAERIGQYSRHTFQSSSLLESCLPRRLVASVLIRRCSPAGWCGREPFPWSTVCVYKSSDQRPRFFVAGSSLFGYNNSVENEQESRAPYDLARDIPQDVDVISSPKGSDSNCSTVAKALHGFGWLLNNDHQSTRSPNHTSRSPQSSLVSTTCCDSLLVGPFASSSCSCLSPTADATGVVCRSDSLVLFPPITSVAPQEQEQPSTAVAVPAVEAPSSLCLAALESVADERTEKTSKHAEASLNAIEIGAVDAQDPPQLEEAHQLYQGGHLVVEKGETTKEDYTPRCVIAHQKIEKEGYGSETPLESASFSTTLSHTPLVCCGEKERQGLYPESIYKKEAACSDRKIGLLRSSDPSHSPTTSTAYFSTFFFSNNLISDPPRLASAPFYRATVPTGGNTPSPVSLPPSSSSAAGGMPFSESEQRSRLGKSRGVRPGEGSWNASNDGISLEGGGASSLSSLSSSLPQWCRQQPVAQQFVTGSSYPSQHQYSTASLVLKTGGSLSSLSSSLSLPPSPHPCRTARFQHLSSFPQQERAVDRVPLNATTLGLLSPLARGQGSESVVFSSSRDTTLRGVTAPSLERERMMFPFQALQKQQQQQQQQQAVSPSACQSPLMVRGADSSSVSPLVPGGGVPPSSSSTSSPFLFFTGGQEEEGALRTSQQQTTRASRSPYALMMMMASPEREGRRGTSSKTTAATSSCPSPPPAVAGLGMRLSGGPGFIHSSPSSPLLNWVLQPHVPSVVGGAGDGGNGECGVCCRRVTAATAVSETGISPDGGSVGPVPGGRWSGSNSPYTSNSLSLASPLRCWQQNSTAGCSGVAVCSDLTGSVAGLNNTAPHETRGLPQANERYTTCYRSCQQHMGSPSCSTHCFGTVEHEVVIREKDGVYSSKEDICRSSNAGNANTGKSGESDVVLRAKKPLTLTGHLNEGFSGEMLLSLPPSPSSLLPRNSGSDLSLKSPSKGIPLGYGCSANSNGKGFLDGISSDDHYRLHHYSSRGCGRDDVRRPPHPAPAVTGNIMSSGGSVMSSPKQQRPCEMKPFPSHSYPQPYNCEQRSGNHTERRRTTTTTTTNHHQHQQAAHLNSPNHQRTAAFQQKHQPHIDSYSYRGASPKADKGECQQHSGSEREQNLSALVGETRYLSSNVQKQLHWKHSVEGEVASPKVAAKSQSIFSSPPHTYSAYTTTRRPEQQEKTHSPRTSLLQQSKKSNNASGAIPAGAEAGTTFTASWSPGTYGSSASSASGCSVSVSALLAQHQATQRKHLAQQKQRPVPQRGEQAVLGGGRCSVYGSQEVNSVITAASPSSLESSRNRLGGAPVVPTEQHRHCTLDEYEADTKVHRAQHPWSRLSPSEGGLSRRWMGLDDPNNQSQGRFQVIEQATGQRPGADYAGRSPPGGGPAGECGAGGTVLIGSSAVTAASLCPAGGDIGRAGGANVMEAKSSRKNRRAMEAVATAEHEAITQQRGERQGQHSGVGAAPPESVGCGGVAQTPFPTAGASSLPNRNVASSENAPLLYCGPDPCPPMTLTRLYGSEGAVALSAYTPSVTSSSSSPSSLPSAVSAHLAIRSSQAELRPWGAQEEVVISQNSSKRKVHRGMWLCAARPDVSFPVAVKFVEDRNARDGRSIKREIECHLYIQQRLHQLQKEEGYSRLEDAWPSAELFGYFLDRKNPGRCVLITRKLSGPDFFDVIRQEHSAAAAAAAATAGTTTSSGGPGGNTSIKANGGLLIGNSILYQQHASAAHTAAHGPSPGGGQSATGGGAPLDHHRVFFGAGMNYASIQQAPLHRIANFLAYEYHKLHWCTLALKRVQQYARLGIRHNDVKPDNIVLDFYVTENGTRALDVKIIDLGTASLQSAKEFTGGTSWYESPEQKILEFYSKKQRNPEAARQVDIGLASDVWAAGLSITEVLVGRRVVDALKLPSGPGPLDFKGAIEGWTIPPEEWVQKARRALLHRPFASPKPVADGDVTDRTQKLAQRREGGEGSVITPSQGFPPRSYCFECAEYIFDHLVRPVASERGTLQSAIDRISEQTERALEHSKRAAAAAASRRSSRFAVAATATASVPTAISNVPGTLTTATRGLAVAASSGKQSGGGTTLARHVLPPSSS